MTTKRVKMNIMRTEKTVKRTWKKSMMVMMKMLRLKIAIMMRRRMMKRKTVRQFSILAGHQTRVTTGVRLRHAHPYTTKYIHKR